MAAWGLVAAAMKLCVSSAKAAATADAGLGGDVMPGLASDGVGRGDVGYMAVICRRDCRLLP